MSTEADRFRIEIHHTTHIDKIPVERLDAAIAEWRARPWWFRVLRRSPLVRIGSRVDVREEPIPGSFDSERAADDAAQAKARELEGEIRVDSAVAVVRERGDEREVVGGWYAGGRSSF